MRTQVQIGPASRPAADAAAYGLPRNHYGAHLLADGGGQVEKQLRWVRHLVGRGGYAKTFFYNIDRRTKGPEKGWIEYVNACYRFELIPVIRLGGRMEGGIWIKPEANSPGNYGAMAQAVQRVVRGLPRSDKCPLYIELWNEPNLNTEWSDQPAAEEYAAFFIQAAKAIRELDDPRIRVLNGGLALSPEWTEKLCKADPEFIRSFDLWASHPYPGNRPPWDNLHDKTAPPEAVTTIDAYLLELNVLKRMGLAKPRVIITETGYDLGNSVHLGHASYPLIDECNRADYMVRAFRDFYPTWPEVVAVIPFEFCGQGWERFDWVYPDSGTNPDGSPDHPHYQYTAVAALAKPTDPTGAINGAIKVAGMDASLNDVSVTITGGHATSDLLGNYFLAKLAPGDYRLEMHKPGFRTVAKDVPVKAATNTVFDAVMHVDQRETLSGVVRGGDDDRPLAGIKITLQPGNLASRTNSAGEYMIRQLAATHYRLTAEADGRHAYEANDLNIVSGRTNTRDFRLGQAPANLPGDNLLSNPSFESGDGGGGKAGVGLGFEPGNDEGRRENAVMINEHQAHTGRCSQSIKVRPAETVVRQITHYNTANPGERYLAGVWMRSDAEDGGGWMSFDFTDNAGGLVQRLEPSKKAAERSQKWVWAEVEGVAPRDARRLSINLHAKGRSGTVYFDDAYLGQVHGKK